AGGAIRRPFRFGPSSWSQGIHRSPVRGRQLRRRRGRVQERRAIAESQDDGALMRRVATGDAQAFGAVAERYTPMLFAVAWRMLADAAEAEDVVQETITRAWVNAANWTPVGGGLGAWLRRIATNL